MLDRICEREVSQIWGVGVDPSALRLLLDGLASRARVLGGSDGALQDSDIQTVFHNVFGRDADEPASLLARRLPGLGAVPGRSGARMFLDIEFFDAASTGDVMRIVEAPYLDHENLDGVKSPLGPLGVSMVGAKVEQRNLSVAIAHMARRSSHAVTTSDLIAVLADKSVDYIGENVTISGADFGSIAIDAELDLSSITFHECTFENVELGRAAPEVERSHFPKFRSCIIGQLDGAMSRSDIPTSIFDSQTSVEKFAALSETNSAVMEANLPVPVKVLITMLRKLFFQRGSGRRYAALKRGLTPASAIFVDDIADLICSHGFADEITLDRRPILMPQRSKSAVALSIVNGPNTSTHPLIVDIRGLA